MLYHVLYCTGIEKVILLALAHNDIWWIKLFNFETCVHCWLCCIESGLIWKKWNESGFRPPLCTYRLNWARRTSWGWWDDWDDTVLQTQDSKFEPWRSEAEHATSRSRRLPTILTFTRGWGRNNFVSFKPPRPGTEPRTLAWKAAVLTTTLGPPPLIWKRQTQQTRANAGLMLGQRRRRWANINTALAQHLVFAVKRVWLRIQIMCLLAIKWTRLHSIKSQLEA